MNRRHMLLGTVAALVAPLVPHLAWARPIGLIEAIDPPLRRAGLAPRCPDRSMPWAHDCLRWRGRVLTGARSHWCHDFGGLPVDETCPEHALCTCEWHHADLDAPVFPQHRQLNASQWENI